MEITSNLSGNVIRKIGLLITKAAELGMQLDGHGFADENKNFGNVYLWLEDYPFTLFINLASDNIRAGWSNPEDGEEVEIDASNMSLNELESWANNRYESAGKD